MFLSNGTLVPDLTAARLGDRTPMLSDASYYAGTAIELSGAWAAYAAIYKTQLWPYTLVNKLARSQARVPLITARRIDDEELEPLPYDDPLRALLRRPNPRMNGFLLWLWTRATRETYGEALWFKLRGAPRGNRPGPVRELWPVHPTNVIVRPNPDTGEAEYLYTAGTRSSLLLPAVPAADVVHFRNYNPENTTRGLSPFEPLRQTLLTEDASRRAAAAMWRNGARPSVVLSHPKTLSKEAHDRIRESWRAQHTGVDKWANPAILEEAITATVVQLSAEDMQYIESRRLGREECCAAFDISPVVVHILDRATFSNVTEVLRGHYRDTMAPRLLEDSATLDSDLRPDFGGDDLALLWQLDDVLSGSPEQRAAANQQMVFSGQMMPNEARRQMGRGPVEGGDQLYISAAVIPLAQAGGAPAPPGADDVLDPPDPAAEAKDGRLTVRGHRAVARRLSKAASLDDVDGVLLTTGLSDPEREHVLAHLAAAKTRGDDVATLRRRLSADVDDDQEPAA